MVVHKSTCLRTICLARNRVLASHLPFFKGKNRDLADCDDSLSLHSPFYFLSIMHNLVEHNTCSAILFVCELILWIPLQVVLKNQNIPSSTYFPTLYILKLVAVGTTSFLWSFVLAPYRLPLPELLGHGFKLSLSTILRTSTITVNLNGFNDSKS